MQKKLLYTGTKLLIAVALAALVLVPISSQAYTKIPTDGELGALGNGDTASFGELGLSQTDFTTTYRFDYEGTNTIYVAASAPRLPADGPPFFFGIDDFSFTVGTVANPIWDSFSVSDDVIGLIITKQELADAGITFGTTLEITVEGVTVGTLDEGSYSGNVGVVPIPAAAWLLGGGLIALLGLRRRFNN